MEPTLLHDIELPNTLALPARAQNVLVATSVVQLQTELAAALNSGRDSDHSNRVFVLGGGSNVVLPNVLTGLTVLMQIKGIRDAGARQGTRVFEVGAGESWQGFVRFCVGQGLGGGIENLSLIPGTVGAAPIQNIGAYGVEVARFIDSVQVLDMQNPAKPPIWLAREDCRFGYRDSLFKQQPGCWLVTQVRFSLRPHTEGDEVLAYAGVGEMLQQLGCKRLVPAVIAEAIARLRRSKLPDPRQHPNVGSFFKNPVLSDAQLSELRQSLTGASKARFDSVPSWPQPGGRKLAAAALVELGGFKRKSAGGVAVWYRQPLVLINTGTADATSVGAFATQIQQTVEAQFGISLEQEPIQVEPPQLM